MINREHFTLDIAIFLQRLFPIFLTVLYIESLQLKVWGEMILEILGYEIWTKY